MNARSLNGCWTCRLRRKKCDEKRPFCSTCINLGIHCEGYGSKPQWMDGGAAEREQAIKIKNIVKQTTKKRSRSISQNIPSPEKTAPSTPCRPPSKVPRSENFMFPHCSENFTWINSNESVRPDINDDLEIILNPPVQTTFDFYQETSAETDSILSQHSSLSSTPFDYIWPTPPQVFSGPDHGASFDLAMKSTVSSESGQAMFSVYNGTRGICASPSQESIPGSGALKTFEAVPWQDSIIHSSLFSSSEDAGSFMHYLDRVFSIQFPFYDYFGNERSRGWLLMLLTRDKAIYYATLTLSQYHYQLQQLGGNSTAEEVLESMESKNYHTMALRQLQQNLEVAHTWNGLAALTSNIRTLTCILQLVFFQIFSCTSGNWSMHLRAAASLVPILVKTRVTLPLPSTPTSENPSELQDLCILSSEERIATDFLLSAFLWLDILASASTRSKPMLELHHELLLEGSKIQLEKLFGCQNWVLLSIFKISALDDWKKECERNRKLSIAELAKRGAQIELSLEQGLDGLGTTSYDANSMENEKSLSRKTALFVHETSYEVTKIYALAALTYLHVVVSGAHPDLHEISNNVSRTMDALETLSDRKLMTKLVWPFCVTSCLVSEEKQAAIRALVPAEAVEEGNFGTFARAFQLVEECWKERKVGKGDCDWSSVMQSTGKRILLI